jgi:hypothetical protein
MCIVREMVAINENCYLIGVVKEQYGEGGTNNWVDYLIDLRAIALKTNLPYCELVE